MKKIHDYTTLLVMLLTIASLLCFTVDAIKSVVIGLICIVIASGIVLFWQYIEENYEVEW